MNSGDRNGAADAGPGIRSMEKNLERLMADVGLLARYAVETVQLPSSVDVERIFEIRRKFESGTDIDTSDFADLVRAYQVLEQRLGPVSASTLRATDDDPEGRKSEAAVYVNRLWWRTMINIALILGSHLVHHYSLAFDRTPVWAFAGLISEYLLPFMYGALGADAFLLRETTHRLHVRQFDPRRIPENRCRFLLGTLAGGVIVLFVSTELVPNQSDAFPFAAGGAALGFLAGFSIDFLFGTIERIISAILPKVVQTHATEDRRAEDELLQKYRRLMDATDNPEDKKVWKTIVEDLETRARG